MDSKLALAMGAASRGDELMVFDWDKAAALIATTHPARAEAGLRGDWEWTGDVIFCDGKIVEDTYTYLASVWAVPELCLDGVLQPCYRMASEVPWTADTKWPDSAKAILEGA